MLSSPVAQRMHVPARARAAGERHVDAFLSEAPREPFAPEALARFGQPRFDGVLGLVQEGAHGRPVRGGDVAEAAHHGGERPLPTEPANPDRLELGLSQ